jgi:leader peptidase (prepilin peptidase)/N-methyltransferase
MTELLLGLTAVLGLAIGSFLNVVIHRVPLGLSVISPPSACPACQSSIRNRDNVPVIGWLLLGGACRHCRQPISVRYPLVEAGTAGLFVVMAVRFGLDVVLPAYLYLAAMGLALAVIDVDVRRLPDVITLPSYGVTAGLLTIAAVFDHDEGNLLRALLGAVAVFGFYFATWFVYPAGMGFGDVKLSGLLGAYLGYLSWAAVTVGIFAGFIYGAVFGVAIVMWSRAGRKTKVPFGPFMLLGALTGILVGPELVTGYLNLTVG